MFGERLRQLRLERGLNQVELGRIIDRSNTTIAQIESGSRIPDIETAKIFAEYFDVSVDYILGRTNVRKADSVEAAHRADDPTSELPPEAQQSIRDFKEFLFKKHGIRYD